MRFLAIFPFLCAVVAFVLSMLALFAGSKAGFLENVDLLTVSLPPLLQPDLSLTAHQLNTSMLGEFSFNDTSSNSSSDGIIGSLKNDINGLKSDIESDIENKINSAIDDVAQAIGIHDFYSAHLMNYCEGYYEPDPLRNATNHPSKNITKCSNRTGMYTFDPTKILQSELTTGINLTDLNWPDTIQDVIHTIEIATRAMFVLYCIGAGFAGLAVLTAIVHLFGGGRLGAACNFLIDFMAFLALGIASAIATAIIVKVVNAVNKYGEEIGVAAYKGNKFLAFTWAATALMLVASIGWIVECCLGRKNKVSSYKEGKRSEI